MFKNEFRCYKYALNHPEPEVFTMCAWQAEVKVLLIWVIYKFLLFLYFLGTFVYILVYWIMYEEMTGLIFGYYGFWAYFIQTDAFMWGFINALWDYLKQTRGNVKDKPKFVYRIFWFQYTAIVSLALLSSVTYWIGLFDKGIMFTSFILYTYQNHFWMIIAHIPNNAIMFFDFWLVAFPVRFLHAYIPFCYFILYHLILVLFHVLFGDLTENEDRILTPEEGEDKNWKYMAHYIMCIYSILIIHEIYACLSFLKLWLRKKYITKEFN